MIPRILPPILLAGLLAEPLSGAQAIPSRAELDEAAAEAEAAPLFRQTAPLRVTLVADIRMLRDERPEEEETEGTLLLHLDDGTSEIPVKVRTRGNFRRDARNCSFPPLRLNVPRSTVEGTVFEGQDKMKLVTPCRQNRDEYQELVLKEYLLYRTLELHTPVSHRTRLLEITYQDASGRDDPFTALAFLLEDDDDVAARARGVVAEWEQFHPATMDGDQAVLVDLFQYMIGNTDWSAPMFHNALMVRDELGRYLTVPYDFDFSGVVDAPYATPDPLLPIRDVTQRLFRGFCREEVDHEAMRALFLERRPAVEALWRDFEALDEGARDWVLEYFKDFYEVLEEPASYRRVVLRGCRRMPG